MNLILNIETATNICSVALSDTTTILSVKESAEANVHSSHLTVFIESLFASTGTKLENLSAVAVSKGPGSYTGLRIGVSVAKGICYALKIPLISINTLQAMACGFTSTYESSLQDSDWICPMIDARRMEVYTSFFNKNNIMMKEVSADIIDEDSYKQVLDKRKLYFIGNGSEKCKNAIIHKNAHFINSEFISASNMAKTAYDKFQNKEFEDTAYFEPFYLKDFIATIPKKNIFK
ncbi:MAG: tRNA (adenosine(37)-N6)-threonylcarbamoyltransferase complex dimerization subunit type 1 TsaB [Chlorobi bacterium]|nr:tRNA (adenosine(37)-N6)-threonylcarbamoyltransferase complex dimerization subunit type 1 TsaB [Chlorobiota bacterium]